MKKKILLGMLLVGVSAGRAEAANFAVITSPPTLLNILILAFAVACLAAAIKVLALVRGGQLSKSWQLFAAGFAVLALCEMAVLGSSFEIIVLPSFVVPASLVLMSGLFLFGIIETKRVLS